MKKRILIVGAGFGGLRVALSLDRDIRAKELKDSYEVVLVDRSPVHVYTPLLYKLAATKHFDLEALDYSLPSLLAGTNIRFVEDTFHFSRGEELRCDYLVLAPGSE